MIYVSKLKKLPSDLFCVILYTTQFVTVFIILQHQTYSLLADASYTYMATYALLGGRFRPISRVNHISWMEVVTQTDRLKSVRLIVGGVFVFALDILCSDRIGFFS